MASTLYIAGGAFELPEGKAQAYTEYVERLAKLSGIGTLQLKNGSQLHLHVDRSTHWAVETDEG